MSKIQTFFTTIKNSAFKPSYYQDVLKAPFSFSLKYFLTLFLTLSLFTVLFISFFLVQKAQPYLNDLKTAIPNLYPNELTLTIKNGEASTNVQEPFFIPLKTDILPQEFKDALQGQPLLQNILVIDTRSQPSEVTKYQTFILLTKNSLSFTSQPNEIRIQSLADIKDFTLSKTLVNQIWAKVTPYFSWIIPITIIFIVIFIPLGTIISKFIFLLIVSLLTLIISKLFKSLKLSYSKVLQINLHALTLPTIIIALFQAFGSNPKIPFFGTIILLIFNLIIFSSLTKPSHS